MPVLDRIQIESSMVCNSHCTFCPRDFTRPKGEMSDELFYKIVKEGKEIGVTSFLPFLNGEPFAFPRLFRWLEHLDSQGAKSHIYTNASLMTKEKVDDLIKYKCIDYVYCSFNGATKHTYEKVMGLDYERTKENIYYLLSVAPFRVRVGMVLIDETIPEIEMFKKLWGKRAKLPKFVNWAGVKHDGAEWTNTRIPCRQVRHHMTVLWDGRVCLCCFDYDGKVILGDLNKQSIREVWKSIKPIRDRHYKLDFDMPLCKTCNFNIEGKIA